MEEEEQQGRWNGMLIVRVQDASQVPKMWHSDLFVCQRLGGAGRNPKGLLEPTLL